VWKECVWRRRDGKHVESLIAILVSGMRKHGEVEKNGEVEHRLESLG
jgi:hypothetical protein